MIRSVCVYCGDMFASDRRRQRYCSNSCYQSHRRDHQSYELARAADRLRCRCDPPDGPDDGECRRCRRPILTADRIAYLRAKYQETA